MHIHHEISVRRRTNVKIRIKHGSNPHERTRKEEDDIEERDRCSKGQSTLLHTIPANIPRSAGGAPCIAIDSRVKTVNHTQKKKRKKEKTFHSSEQ